MTPLKRLVLVAAALLAGWPTAAHGQCTGCKFPATGQMTCWDSSGNVIPCAGTGQDGDLRKGAPLSYTDNGNGTVTDNNTGLVWEKLSRDGSVHDVNNTYTWASAFTGHVATLNSTSFAGHTDWRVPNYKELVSILNLQNNLHDGVPAVSPAFNTNCTPGCTVTTCSCTATSNGSGLAGQLPYYWSSTTDAGSPDSAWSVDFGLGAVAYWGKAYGFFVRAVRGGSSCLPATGQTTCWDTSGNVLPCAGTGQDGDLRKGAPLSYTDNGNGTVTDNNTGLVWEKLSRDGSVHDVGSRYTWASAFTGHVAMLNSTSFAGHSDWRVPNYKELISILDLQNWNPALSSAFNTNCTPGCTVTSCNCTAVLCWSSTTDAGDPILAWLMDFFYGSVIFDYKSDSFFVRAVRGGS